MNLSIALKQIHLFILSEVIPCFVEDVCGSSEVVLTADALVVSCVVDEAAAPTGLVGVARGEDLGEGVVTAAKTRTDLL